MSDEEFRRYRSSVYDAMAGDEDRSVHFAGVDWPPDTQLLRMSHRPEVHIRLAHRFTFGALELDEGTTLYFDAHTESLTDVACGGTCVLYGASISGSVTTKDGVMRIKTDSIVNVEGVSCSGLVTCSLDGKWLSGDLAQAPLTIDDITLPEGTRIVSLGDRRVRAVFPATYPKMPRIEEITIP